MIDAPSDGQRQASYKEALEGRDKDSYSTTFRWQKWSPAFESSLHSCDYIILLQI